MSPAKASTPINDIAPQTNRLRTRNALISGLIPAPSDRLKRSLPQQFNRIRLRMAAFGRPFCGLNVGFGCSEPFPPNGHPLARGAESGPNPCWPERWTVHDQMRE